MTTSFDHLHPPLMECGHTANAEGKIPGGTFQPSCVICGCFTIADEQPDFTGRKAVCSYCKVEHDSSERLAFFRHQPEQDTDSFYCGCRGWD